MEDFPLNPTAALIICLLIAVIFLYYRSKMLALKVQTTLSHRKSSEVRTGKISEVLAPLSSLFPVDVKKPGTSTVFIGQPIDYIHFDSESGVTFIEVKSGGSSLSPEQKRLKKAIQDGLVQWKEVRIKG